MPRTYPKFSIYFSHMNLFVTVSAFRNSNALLDRKVAMENSLQQQVVHYESQFKKLIESYRRAMHVERVRWRQEKAQYDANRLKKLMPSNWNTTPAGTPLTQAVVGKYREGTIPHVIGTCMADIADAVIIKCTDPRINDQPFRDFQPSKTAPTPETIIADQNTGETLAQKVRRIQNHYGQEIQSAKMKLASAEEERKRCWKKMEKCKTELQQMQAAQGSMGGSRHFGQSPPSYTPGRRDARGIESYAPTQTVSTSDSKYSVARVRERQLPDGCVEPIQRKKGADGLYQRPAGRARKFMNWDAVRGVWVPSGNN